MFDSSETYACLRAVIAAICTAGCNSTFSRAGAVDLDAVSIGLQQADIMLEECGLTPSDLTHSVDELQS